MRFEKGGRRLDYTEVFKALSNETRRNMLEWLREPEKHFKEKDAFLSEKVRGKNGVCVGDLQEKANLSQSTVSNYLQMLQKAGLLASERHGQWTYYRRNEENIRKLVAHLKYL